MAQNFDIIESLMLDHRRLGRLLQLIDNGRWWTDDEPCQIDLSKLEDAAGQIRVSIARIELLVGNVGIRSVAGQGTAAPLSVPRLMAEL
ncbi:hypothetical protein LRS73_08710 [Methylobacterium currus]|uniref:hypothetical protein n=1 Tax=Methylobacterium currus TaxID=2051553 RepID=UPI001E4A8919|nr:hypothetical protein [Methylobacterium currus]UHC17909.1 hypothetical protein LRS73_08710 [Methylobacterium currus]